MLRRRPSGPSSRHDLRRRRHGDPNRKPRRAPPGAARPLSAPHRDHSEEMTVLGYDYPILGLFWTML